VTASVSPMHLYFTDQDLEGYDTNLKLNPPLRGIEDQKALLEALLDGTIDCVASHHTPLDKDCKVCEFEYAKFGVISLESTAGVLGQLGIAVEKLADILSIAPRRIFRLPDAVIRESAEADLTLFLPDESFIFTRERIRSRSSNTPFLGKTLKGVVAGTIHKQKISLQRS
jgi:dihydroorotase